MMKKSFPDVMTINEAIEYLRIPRSSLYKLAQEGKVPARKVGRHWRFHRDVLEEWLKRGMRDLNGNQKR